MTPSERIQEIDARMAAIKASRKALDTEWDALVSERSRIVRELSKQGKKLPCGHNCNCPRE